MEAMSDKKYLDEVSEIGLSLTRFTKIMNSKLMENIDKGGWKECPISYLMHRLEQEVIELKESLLDQDEEDVSNEAADVANFAMMISDNIARISLSRSKQDENDK